MYFTRIHTPTHHISWQSLGYCFKFATQDKAIVMLFRRINIKYIDWKYDTLYCCDSLIWWTSFLFLGVTNMYCMYVVNTFVLFYFISFRFALFEIPIIQALEFLKLFNEYFNSRMNRYICIFVHCTCENCFKLPIWIYFIANGVSMPLCHFVLYRRLFLFVLLLPLFSLSFPFIFRILFMSELKART